MLARSHARLAALGAAGIQVVMVPAHGSAAGRAVAALWRMAGVRPAEVLLVDDCEDGCPIDAGVTRTTLAQAPPILAELVRSRGRGALPAVPDDAAWTIEILGAEPDQERVRDSWLTIADGVIGTVGSPLCAYPAARRDVIAANAYVGRGPTTDLLRVPDWTRLAGTLLADRPVRRVLDLRTGLQHHILTSTLGELQAVALACRTTPGVAGLRAIGPGARAPGWPPRTWAGRASSLGR